MYFNFSNFWGQTSAGGDKPWSKNGDKCQMGGLAKFSPDEGTPVPPGKKPWGFNPNMFWFFHSLNYVCQFAWASLQIFFFKLQMWYQSNSVLIIGDTKWGHPQLYIDTKYKTICNILSNFVTDMLHLAFFVYVLLCLKMPATN